MIVSLLGNTCCGVPETDKQRFIINCNSSESRKNNFTMHNLIRQ